MKSLGIVFVVCLCVAVVLAAHVHHGSDKRDNDSEKKRSHHSVKKHHEAKHSRHFKHANRAGTQEDNSTSIDSTTESNDDGTTTAAFGIDVGEIFAIFVNILSCLPRILTNLADLLSRELRRHDSGSRVLQFTINNETVYRITLDAQMTFCDHHSGSSCAVSSQFPILNIPSIPLPNIQLPSIPFFPFIPQPRINDRADCIRQIICNITTAIVHDLQSRGPMSKRELLLRLDNNVIFRITLGPQPSCATSKRSGYHHEEGYKNHENSLHKKRLRHNRDRRSIDGIYQGHLLGDDEVNSNL